MKSGWITFAEFLVAPAAPVVVFDINPKIGTRDVLSWALFFLIVNYVVAVILIPIYILFRRLNLVKFVPMVVGSFVAMVILEMTLFAFPTVEWYKIREDFIVKDWKLTPIGWQRHFFRCSLQRRSGQCRRSDTVAGRSLRRTALITMSPPYLGRL